MDVNSILPFLDAIVKIMPELGFQKVERGRLRVGTDNKIDSLGVMVIVGVTHQLRGNVAYNMTEESARAIASKMMMGMPVSTFDAMAESAISEMGNMLAANAGMLLEKKGIKVDISPPTLVTGIICAANPDNLQRLIVEVLIDGMPMEVHLSISS
ncbi:MAG: chemotaxis protein CheX [Negativicutes bacterium]|nr:chemotaxis protein CheX [Negativicutes bacterium]